MPKTVIINQPRGLGDILFIIKISQVFLNKGHKIIFPIDKDFFEIKKHFPDIDFIREEDFTLFSLEQKAFDGDNIIYLPLRFSSDCDDQSNTLIRKYELVNLDFNTWRYIKYERDLVMEKKLYYDILDLKDNEKYNLINCKKSNNSINISVDNGYKNIYMGKHENVSLIDWSLVLENAVSIHTIGTSINFLIELINLKDDCDYVIYNDDYDYSLYSKIVSKHHRRIVI